MKHTGLLRTTAVAITLWLLLAGCTTLSFNKDCKDVHWSYDGDTGPDRWAHLCKGWEACGSADRQSPIDIHAPTPTSLPAVGFGYRSRTLAMENNGHTIQLDLEGAGIVHLDGRSYEVKQVHFHAQSEHTVDGKHYPMEMHIVHEEAGGDLLVVGAFIEQSTPAVENPSFEPFWSLLPSEPHKPVDRKDISVNPQWLLPPNRDTYRYIGSLTTPPCTPGVRWLVMTTPISLSGAQLKQFTDIFASNHRPVQAPQPVLVDQPR